MKYYHLLFLQKNQYKIKTLKNGENENCEEDKKLYCALMSYRKEQEK